MSQITWDEFKVDVLHELYDNQFERGLYIFRGQSCAEWGLVSSFDRLFHNRKLSNQMLTNFKELCENYDLCDTKILADEAKLLALGQHFGLPTRLLDWSYSPYIAAFFAFNDIYSNNDDNEHVAIWCLKCNEIFEQNELLEIVKVKQAGNFRIRNQDGAFTLLKSLLYDDLSIFLDEKHPNILRKYIISKSEAEFAIKDLDAMGINNIRIYPDLSGASLHIKLMNYFEDKKNL